jgi:hypothetical protein
MREMLQAQFLPGMDLQNIYAKNYVTIELNKMTNRVKIRAPPNRTLTFSKTLCAILGIDELDNPLVNEDDGPLRIYNELTADLDGGIHSLYIYCDILEHVCLGDVKAPLLRIVDARGKNCEMRYRHYDQLTYVPLQKKHFESVEIDIRDSFGEKIAFENGQVIVTLHFRQSKNPYFL